MIEKYGKYWQQMLPLVVFAGLWFLLLKHLSVHWSINPQYSFGWFGPFICAYLFFNRWQTRPPTEAVSFRRFEWIYWVVCFALLPTWVIEQPNPDWRVISWLLGLEVVALSLGGVYFVGGRSWLKHFAFSICFILTTVPWPAGVEQVVTQGFMRTSTSATVWLLNTFSMPAMRHGNVIEIATGQLGIDEACSGIRSFPAALMFSIFLGELCRLTWRRRLVLIVCGALIAFLCNVGRTFVLSWIAAKDGIESVSVWHDSAGFVILSICFLLLWGLARLLTKSPAHHDTTANPSLELAPRPLLAPRRLWIGLGVWLILLVLGTEIWYRSHETRETLRWTFEWPIAKERFSEVAISKYAAGELKYDHGRAASWRESDGTGWTAMFFTWGGEPTHSRILAHLHRPDDCLPGVGYKLGADLGSITFKAKDILIPFRVLHFDYNGKPAYVFYCLWQDRPKTAQVPKVGDAWNKRLVGLESSDRSNLLVRFQSVLLGQRDLAQQTLEIVIFGYATHQEAEDALRRQMENLIRA
jgi:exosortase